MCPLPSYLKTSRWETFHTLSCISCPPQPRQGPWDPYFSAWAPAADIRGLVQVVEHSLGHLPFQEKCVVTATGHPYTGVDFAKKLCGVSIIRSGESMENALRACCKGIKIGKILVHRCAYIPDK